MSPAPREFKFVGGPSRKRRRNVVPPKSRASRASFTTKTPAATRSRDSALAENNRPQDAPRPPVTAANAEDAVTSAPAPISGVVNDGLTGGLDWSNGSFMDSLIDTSFWLTDDIVPPADTAEVPIYFGLETPLYLEGSPPAHEMAEDKVEERVSEDGCRNAEPKATCAPNAITSPVLTKGTPQNIASSSMDTVSRLLELYDREFCVMPLTHDFSSNPFRYKPTKASESPLLLHCVLALCYKHLNRDTGTCTAEAITHKSAALQLLAETEKGDRDGYAMLSSGFLDAILILMTLSCATSARGPWIWYLTRARRVIDTVEALQIPLSPRMRATIEILAWWDIALALTTRQGCLLSDSTITGLLRPADEGNGNTFYSVSGCPAGMCRYMVRLGVFAKEHKLSSSMTCVNFDMEPVLEVEKGIREWSATECRDRCSALSPPEDEDDSIELAHHDEDLYHAAEAWRYALLVYIYRVFKYAKCQFARDLAAIEFFARKTLNHVFSCRRSTMVQKQLLLPVFLAGCETKDEHFRQEVRGYCTWWNEKTRYDMFYTAHVLLEEVWADDNPSTWWASIIDQMSSCDTDGRQYLFG